MPWVEGTWGQTSGGVKDDLAPEARVSLEVLSEQGLRVALPVPAAGGDEGVRWQPPRGPRAHTAEQEGGRQVAEAATHPPGPDAVLPGQVDPVQCGPTGLR